MEQIKTQDCYLPVEKEADYLLTIRAEHLNAVKFQFLEKHSNMVVLTKDQLIEIIGDAFDAGFSRAVFEASPHNGIALNKAKYINNLFKIK